MSTDGEQDDYVKLMKLEDEMNRVCIDWRECHQLIEQYRDQQVISSTAVYHLSWSYLVLGFENCICNFKLPVGKTSPSLVHQVIFWSFHLLDEH